VKKGGMGKKGGKTSHIREGERSKFNGEEGRGERVSLQNDTAVGPKDPHRRARLD